jgi:excisionase family DNA binding protein
MRIGLKLKAKNMNKNYRKLNNLKPVTSLSPSDKDRGGALLDVSELAVRLSVSKDWVYDAVNYHDLPCVRFNSRLWRFHWPTVLAWLQRLR